MKNWKSFIITVFSFFAVGGMVTFNSCVKDPCTDLKCQNRGVCSDGFCQCPTGYEGAECEITAASRFVGTWAGSVRINNNPISADTVRIELTEKPNKITVHMGAGNTSVLGYTGIAETPETHFVTYTTDGVEVHFYITVDGGLMQLYTQTISQFGRQNGYFSGVRISSN
jgi:hypothetical protein